VIQRFILLTLLLASALLAAPRVASAGGNHKPPPITIVLYLESQGPAGEASQPELDLRDRLRTNDRLETLVFEPDSPTFILAARNANPPISLDSVTTFDTRLALAQAVGAQFALMAAPTDIGSDRMDLRLFEIAPISRSWSFAGQKPKDAAKAVADQVIRAESEKTPLTPSLPASPVSGASNPVSGGGPTHPQIVLPPNEPAPSQPAPANSTAPAPTPAPATISTPPLPPPVSQAPANIGTPPPAAQTPANTSPPIAQTPAKSAPPQPEQQTPPAENPPPSPVQPIQPTQIPMAPPALPTPPAPQETSQKAITLPPPKETAPPPPATAQPTRPATPSANGTPTQENLPPATQPPTEQTLATESPIAPPPPGPALNDAAIGKMTLGDTALQQSDVYGAIEFYREAVDEAPRAAEPRMRLIQAYLQAGLKDQALDEERRALMLDPNNSDLQNMLKSQTTDGTLPGADLAVQQAAVARNPQDESAWIALGDSYWNSGQPDQALQAYEKAAHLKPGDVAAQAHLARLYAATSQYDKSLDALTKAGPQGYPYALRIIAARTDSLIADIESAHDAFVKGDSTREQFYDSLKKADLQSQALAQFVEKINPPDEYNVAYLHRRLATNLLAQATAEWLSYVETNEDQHSQQAALLQSEAAREMKTASIAERLQSSLSAVSH
jgi:tetratricopeptide (TPR) repeat protein